MRTPSTVGVVGLGSWGRVLARHFDRLPQTELKWLCDRDPARRLAHGGLSSSAAWTFELDDLLDDELLDAVVVATPTETHHAVAREALLAGKHVLVAKPLARSEAEADDLAELARDRERHLVVGHTMRFQPSVERLKELLDGGSLGQVLYLHASRWSLGEARTNEDALWGLGAHDLSTILYLLGDEPMTVSAHGDAYILGGVPDVVFCHLAFATGISAHLHLSWLDPERARCLTVVGSRGMAVLDAATERERKLVVYDRRASSRRGDAGNELVEVSHGDTVIPYLAGADAVCRRCASFGELLRTPVAGPEPGVDLRHAVTVVATLAALQRSLDRRGLPVPLALPAGAPVHAVATPAQTA